MKNDVVSSVVIAVGLALLGVFVGKGLVGTREPVKTVVVKGLAEQKVRSNQGVWTLRYKVVGDTMPSLYQAINQSEQTLKTFLTTEGFKPEEISVQAQSITDNQSNTYNSNDKVARYVADGSVSVFTTNVNTILSANQHVGRLVKNGVVLTGTGTQFNYTLLNQIKPKMLALATANARMAAGEFAKQSETRLGMIKNARQGLFTITDANGSYDSGTSVEKKVRVVSTVTFILR